MPTDPLPIQLRGVYPPPRVPTPVRLLLMTLSLAVIATAAVGYSLGYKVNWQNGTVQQTGIIALTTDMGNLHAHILFNGKETSDHFPVRAPLLFPGHYDIEVRQDGYQPWVWHTNLEPNKVLAAQNLVIIKKLDLMKVQPTSASVPAAGSHNGIDLRYNELWINGQFITRLSQQFVSAQWYPDNTHVAYQAGSHLRLYDTITGITLDMAAMPDDAPVTFGFRDAGRTLIYQVGATGQIYSVALYDAS